MTTWAVILAVAAGSFLFRLGPLMLLQRATLSPAADRMIRHAGLAAIAALIANSIRHNAHGTSVAPTLLAVAVGVVLAVREQPVLRIIAAGGAIYALASAVTGLFA